MSPFEQPAFGPIVHTGTRVRHNSVSGRPVEAARAQTLHRATLTADLLDRHEVAGMACRRPDGGIRVVPVPSPGDDPILPGRVFDFATFEDATRFLRDDIVPRLMARSFADLLDGARREIVPPREVLTAAAA